VRRTVPPSAEIEEQIDRLLAVGVGENPRESLSELARLGARLIIQRAVEDEFDAWLGRARDERRAEAPPGLRNGFRARRVQTAEGELGVEIPQVREAAEPFVSKLFPRGTKLLRTEPLRAMVIGAFVRGLSMRDVESLCEQAGLGKLSKSTAARICTELRDRFAAFQRRDLYDIHLAALFLDAVFLSVRRDGPKEGVLVAWGFTEDGERVLLSVMLGMRESHEDSAGARTRFDQPWAGGADADRRRRRPRADHGRRAVLACLRPPALRRSPRAQPARQAARTRTRTHPPRLLAGTRRGHQRARRQAATPGARRRARSGRLHRRGPLPRRRPRRPRRHLRYPTRHRRRWRSTNLLDRSLGELKRRTKVIGRFPGETSCLTLVWAVLDLYISHATNGIKFTQLERQHLKRTRYDGHDSTTPEEVTAA
jgi:putative transposase